MNFLRLALILVVLASTEAHATRKTDVIHFTNGDKLTGEIKALVNGILQLSTDAMGTINIEWPQVARIESIYYYEFRLTSGERHFTRVKEAHGIDHAGVRLHVRGRARSCWPVGSWRRPNLPRRTRMPTAILT